MALTMKDGITKLVCALATAFLLLWNVASATNITMIRQQILQNLRTNPQERAYLSFDNTYYKAGETLFFKAIVISDPYGTATKLSSVLYVELLAPTGWIVERQKLKIVDGKAYGAFRLGTSISSGLYEVRAYTAWMLNYTNVDASGRNVDVSQSGSLASNECWGIFSRVLPIYGDMKTRACERNKTKKRSKDDLSVQFYPEGGNVVKGLDARVAFEVKDEWGRHMDVKGWLTDGKARLREVKTTHDGKGVFNVLGKETLGKLKLVIDQAGRKKEIPLPRPVSVGYSMKVDVGSQTEICIARNSQTEGGTLGLSVCCRGKMSTFQVLDMRNSMEKKLSICMDSLTTGVNVVTLYDERGGIMAQREFFVNKHDMESNIDVVFGKRDKEYKEHERIDATIKLTDKNTGGALADENFSVSVCAKEEDTPQMQENVLAYMLLSSELRGYVSNPQFYFDGGDSLRKEALDVLLMVQGWTRYDYGKLSSPVVSVPKYPIERGLSLVGRILATKYNSDIVYSTSYTGDGYTEKQTDLGEGYGDKKYWKQWNNPEKTFWLRMDLHSDEGIITSENSIGSSDYFSFALPSFYGKGTAYLMMNRQSMALDSKNATGIDGHLLVGEDAKNNYLENTHVLELEIPLAPWPRRYDYYENALVKKEESKAGNIQKALSKEACDTPNFSMDINSLMTYISCEKGRVVDFCMRPLQVNRNINLINPNIIDFLPKLGISGNVECLVNGKPVSSYNMPGGSASSKKQMFPADMAFTKVDVYSCADAWCDMRSQKTELGKVEISSKGKKPNAILDFVSDGACYADGSRFVGNRIEYNGYNKPVEFYVSDYSAKLAPEEEDKRRTLLWIPNLTTDKHGVAHLIFRNGSHSENVSVRIEGITKDGKFIYYAE